ncbi:MAG: NUDIX hydrolase [Anaerolineae bacterium]|nr:NUDIX hydrolase [Anaerolineae bacterium]
MDPIWLEWAKRLQAIAQDALAYCANPFDRERFEQVRQIAVEIVSRYADAPEERVRELFAGEEGYATPKVDLRGVVFQDERILLVRERRDMRWTLPGGWADVGDSPSEGVEREVREESGYEVRAVKLLALYDRNKHPHPPHPQHIYKLFFLCQLLGGEPRESIETAGVGFFAEDELPELSLTRVLPEQIHRFFEHLRHPEWPTEFD